MDVNDIKPRDLRVDSSALDRITKAIDEATSSDSWTSIDRALKETPGITVGALADLEENLALAGKAPTAMDHLLREFRPHALDGLAANLVRLQETGVVAALRESERIGPLGGIKGAVSAASRLGEAAIGAGQVMPLREPTWEPTLRAFDLHIPENPSHETNRRLGQFIEVHKDTSAETIEQLKMAVSELQRDAANRRRWSKWAALGVLAGCVSALLTVILVVHGCAMLPPG